MRSIPPALETILPRVQKPARYIGGEIGCVYKDDPFIRFAFCFPDLYEVGMSHLGMKILYGLKNAVPDVWCERVFAPDRDFERLMRCNGIPLYALESLEPIASFDFIGFTLQYELCYPTVLNMLDLAGVPLYSSQRQGLQPIVVAGGPCVCNPEPMADFIDIFILGEGEEVNLELIDCYRKAKQKNWDKQTFLAAAALIPGIYVPFFYRVDYLPDGRIQNISSIHPNAPAKISKRIVRDLNKTYYPDDFVVPFIQTVHDRAMVEVLRGCIRGCRFCQAGFIYRPFREKTGAVIDGCAKTLCQNTGYDELSLTSLSTSDLSEIQPLLCQLLDWTQQKGVNVTLPSLRVDNFSPELARRVAKLRKSSLTFAPEAGTQRMRDVINKNVTEEELLRTCLISFQEGYTSVKLYFMIGLPTETLEDVSGIAELCQKVVDVFYRNPLRPKGKGVQVTASVACFIPKPFTPFQFAAQDTPERLGEKQKVLLDTVKTKSKKIRIKYHDNISGFLEGVLARGDRRLCDVLYGAWKRGAVLDSWDEHFSMERWLDAAKDAGLDLTFYANRTRDYDEVLPWSHLDYGVDHDFLVREYQAALDSAAHPHCRQACSACGANRLLDRPCFTYGGEMMPDMGGALFG